jgi:hypothetical protein
MNTTADGTHDLTGGHPFGDGPEVDIAMLNHILYALRRIASGEVDDPVAFATTTLKDLEY